MSNEDTPGGGPVLARNCTVDAVVAVLLALLGIVVMVEARRLGAGWTTDGPGAGYFPFYIGLLLSIGGAGILYQSLLSKSADKGAFVDREQMKRVLSVLLPTIAYVVGILMVGLYVASAVFIAAFMVWLGKYGAAKSIAVGVGVNALFFAMFEAWFKVPLFKGTFDLLAFLGY